MMNIYDDKKQGQHGICIIYNLSVCFFCEIIVWPLAASGGAKNRQNYHSLLLIQVGQGEIKWTFRRLVKKGSCFGNPGPQFYFLKQKYESN